MRKNINAGLLILVIGSFGIAACSGPQASPTTNPGDPNVIYTQAAETVQAGMAMTEQVKPTATFTQTVVPTNTTDPVIAEGMTATAMSVLQPPNITPTFNVQEAVTGQTTPTPTVAITLPALPTATLAAGLPAKTSGDKAELVDQSPKDGTEIQKEASFDMTLVIKNSGTTTWTTAYSLVYFAGDRMDSPADFQMPNEVKPGGMVKLVFPMKAPNSTGDKTIIWAVRNADGVNFYPLYLKLKITE